MANIQVYWDGNVGACEYETRRKVFSSKPTIPTITFDYIIYSEDDGVAKRVYNSVISALTDDEITACKSFANANAEEITTESSDEKIDVHNSDTTAHHDIRTSISTLSEFAHKVASVYSTEIVLSELGGFATIIEWPYVLRDINDCTKSTDYTKWVCPVAESYDVTVRLGFEGLSSSVDNTVTIELLKNGALVKTMSHTYESGSVGFPSLELQQSNLILAEGDYLQVRVTAPTSGVIVPSRSFFVVDNAGFLSAYRTMQYFYNTLGNLMFTDGYQAEVTEDTSNSPAVIAGTWDSDIVVV